MDQLLANHLSEQETPSSSRTIDLGETKAEIRLWERARKADVQYGVKLRRIAKQVGDLIRSFAGELPSELPTLERILERYSELITPWARVVARSMLADVSRRDEAIWASLSKEAGRALREEIQGAPIGEAYRRLMEEQVSLITSIPTNAAQRVHNLVIEGLSHARRPETIAKMIMESEHVSIVDATRIARTEVARSASILVQVRAEYIGSPGYLWRTARDGDVRKSHREMEGQFVKWDTPPTLSDGTTTHAGQIYNCRCHPEVIIPNEYGVTNKYQRANKARTK